MRARPFGFRQITEKTPLDRVIEMFRALGIRYLLVTQNGQLVGILKKKDILEHIELIAKASATAARTRCERCSWTRPRPSWSRRHRSCHITY